MRISIIISLLILIAGGIFGWVNQQHLTELRAQRKALGDHALQLGISASPNDTAADLKVANRLHREHDSKMRDAHDLSLEFLTLAGEMERSEKGGGQPDQTLQKRGFDVLSKMINMDAEQIKMVINAMRDDANLSPKTRADMVLFSILVLGQEHPQAALAFFAESSDLVANGVLGGQAVSMTLTHWAENDPMAALGWIRKNSTAYGAMIGDDAKRGIIAGAARTDPRLAFKLISELGIADPEQGISSLVGGARTPMERTAILGALREYLGTIQDSDNRDIVMNQSLESMGRELTGENFDVVQKWMGDAKLNAQEQLKFTQGLSYFNTKGETGRWIDWMATSLPPEEATRSVRELIGQWTQQDYQAAGKWLTTASPGPARDACIASYAETVAEYDPRIAAQWANMLPAAQRQSTYQSIFDNWPISDPDGAAAFAKEHGLNPDPDPDQTGDNGRSFDDGNSNAGNKETEENAIGNQ